MTPRALALSFTLTAATALAAGPPLRLPDLSPARIKAYEEASDGGNDAYEAQDYARAARLMSRAGAIYAGNEGLWYNLACVQALMGRPTLALQSLEKARLAGWRDAAWPAQDPDLAVLRDTPELKAWLDVVRASGPVAAPVVAAGDLANSEDEIDPLAKAASDRLAPLSSVLGREQQRQAALITAWKVASFQALAGRTTDAAARERLRWGAIDTLTREDGAPRDPDTAQEVVDLVGDFRRELATSEHDADAWLRDIRARHSLVADDAPDAEAKEAAYVREMLVLVATAPSGAATRQAMASLLGLLEDDDAAVRALHGRLRREMPDDKAFDELMLARARGVHYRMTGLPAFAATTLDARALTPASLRGRVTLIDFWATWCGPCRGELPHLKAAYEKFHARGFDIVGVSLDNAPAGDPAKFKAWCDENGVTWPQIFDGKGWEAELAKTFHVKSIPLPLLVDRDGRVAFADNQLRGEQLLARVESLLGPDEAVAGE
jgi:thiol-disulfide isomerase/thioredoxin